MGFEFSEERPRAERSVGSSLENGTPVEAVGGGLSSVL